MQKIFVARGNQHLGQFWPQEVADGLKSGRFWPTDLAWKEGLETWVPLSAFPDLPMASAGIEGAGEEAPSESVAPGEIPDSAGLAQPAWERRESLGFLSAAITTVKQVLFSPGETFAALPPHGGIFASLVFSTIFSWIGVLFVLAYQAAALLVNPAGLSGGEDTGGAASGAALQGPTLLGVAIFAPVFILVGLFFGAGLLHLLLLLLGGARQPFTTTLRVLAYVQGATALLQVIPLCGGLVTSVWYFISATLGLSQAHQTEAWRVIVALLLPLLLVCGLAFMLAVFVGVMAVAEGPH